jgi:hypothetical protein
MADFVNTGQSWLAPFTRATNKSAPSSPRIRYRFAVDIAFGCGRVCAAAGARHAAAAAPPFAQRWRESVRAPAKSTRGAAPLQQIQEKARAGRGENVQNSEYAARIGTGHATY